MVFLKTKQKIILIESQYQFLTTCNTNRYQLVFLIKTKGEQGDYGMCKSTMPTYIGMLVHRVYKVLLGGKW